MKFLIDGDFKAMRCGDFVVASVDNNEFIFDTENNDLMAIQLLEIANSNKIDLDATLKIKDMVSNLETGLLNLNLPRVNEMGNTEKVLEIVLGGFETGKNDDEMLMEIVQAGIPFRNAAKMFRACVEDNGLRLSTKKRAEAIEMILEDNEFYPETFDEVIAMSERIAIGDSEKGLEKVSDTTTSQAIKAIKKFLKEKEIEFPKPPKKVTGGLRDLFLKFACANLDASDDVLAAWYVENTKDKTDEDVAKWMKKYHSTINHGRNCAIEVSGSEEQGVIYTDVKTATEA